MMGSISLEQILFILAMSVVTFMPRAFPLLLLSTLKLRPFILRWLAMVPPAVLAALVLPEILLSRPSKTSFFISFDNVFLLAAIPTSFIGWKTKNFALTIIIGIASVALLRYLI